MCIQAFPPQHEAVNISFSFQSISREAIKDKKRKTPKKLPKGHLAPGIQKYMQF